MVCCPKLDSEMWHDKVIEWNNKRFIKDSVFTFFYIPLTFGKVMKRLDIMIRNANVIMTDWLCLADHTSSWNMDVYLAVDKDIPNVENVTMNGMYYSKVYEGNFKDTGIWCKDFEKSAKEKAYNIGKIYMWYTTCPKCAKKYGKNYVVVIAKIA